MQLPGDRDKLVNGVCIYVLESAPSAVANSRAGSGDKLDGSFSARVQSKQHTRGL